MDITKAIEARQLDCFLIDANIMRAITEIHNGFKANEGS